MQIIQTLRNNTTPDTADQLFKTLVETSEAVELKNKEYAEEEAKVEEKLGIEDQLQLLLQNLNQNSLLNQKKPKRAVNNAAMAEGPGQPAQEQSASSAPTQLITQAYHLINEVIMYPQIMWTRNFFYSLGAMNTSQQTIMHEWFTEMNEVSKLLYS